MNQVTTDYLTALLADHEPPCVSLYQPTHRRHPENQQERQRASRSNIRGRGEANPRWNDAHCATESVPPHPQPNPLPPGPPIPRPDPLPLPNPLPHPVPPPMPGPI